MLDIVDKNKVDQKVENRDKKQEITNEQANINATTATTTTINTPDEPTSIATTISNNSSILAISNYSAAIDNINVIYDNDTTVLELPLDDNYGGLSSGNSLSFGKHKSSSKMGDFVNSDRTEEVERENYATCLIEPFGDVKQVGSQVGQLNFWQAINNRGALHILARFRYTEHGVNKDNTATNDSRQPVFHSIEKRESFRAPVEHIPIGINNSVGINNYLKRSIYRIWMANECKAVVNNERSLFIELSPSIELPQQNDEIKIVDFDAELTIGRFNLSGPNSILNKHLVFELPDQFNKQEMARKFACCKIKQVDSFPVNELDNLASVSVVQPVREDLLKATELSATSTTATTTTIISATNDESEVKKLKVNESFFDKIKSMIITRP